MEVLKKAITSSACLYALLTFKLSDLCEFAEMNENLLLRIESAYYILRLLYEELNLYCQVFFYMLGLFKQ